MRAITNGHEIGPLDLLVLQPTPLCNLNCSYCYLPDRKNNAIMQQEVIDKIIAWLIDANIVQEKFTIVWHAGEPLTVGPEFYRKTSHIFSNSFDRINIRNCVQTNGTLISDEWCELFKHYRYNVGVSIDGPENIHDQKRKTWSNKGSYAATMRGIHLLRKREVPFYTISVLTAESLSKPELIFDFFIQNNITNIAFNIEEIENSNSVSSLNTSESYAHVVKFFDEIINQSIKKQFPIAIRELDNRLSAIASYKSGPIVRGHETRPFAIVTINAKGDYSTYSPELNSAIAPEYNNFILGNVSSVRLQDALKSELYQKMESAISEGLNLCEQTCSYYGVCGGGSPSNKYFENGSFRTSETMQCQLTCKALTDAVLNKMGI